jgi:RNA polymerase sigma-70 factor (ECF subfamily)
MKDEKDLQNFEFDTMSIKEFENLFKTFYPVLCGFAAKYLNNLVLSEEVVQDVFYSVWKNRASIKITSSGKSYLFTAVKNRSLQHIEHQKSVFKYEKLVSKQEIITAPDPHSELQYAEMFGIFEKTLNSLPEKCRTIFKLNRFEGLKYSEIAKKLSISVKTVEANMSRALKKLRTDYKTYSEAFIVLILTSLNL